MNLDGILATLRLDTNARGGWLLGPTAIRNNQHENEVLAAAVEDASIQSPRNVLVTSETHVDLVDRGIYAMPIGPAVLVVVFDERSSAGLVRLRVWRVKEPIARALAARP